jgi:WD40 repeat protein
VTPDGQCAISASLDQTLKVWELETEEVLVTFTRDVWALCCACSEALQLILSGDAGSHLRLEKPKPKTNACCD